MLLHTMRKNMKMILWVTVIAFVLLMFFVWGADMQLGSGPPPNTVGTVNGTPISTAAYAQLLDRNRRSVRGEGDLDANMELAIEENTWNSIVDEMLLRQEAHRRGFEARDAEVRSVLLNSPPSFITQDPNFQTQDGRFDLAAYRAVIQDPSTPESFLLQLEYYVRESLPLEKLQNLILSGAKVTDDELRRSYQEQNEKAKITYVVAEASGAEINDEISDQEIYAYYEAHRDEYRTGKRVTIVYASLPRVATAADSASMKVELSEFASDARAAAAAESAGTVDIDTPNNFAALAQTFSDAPSAENGGLSEGFLSPSELSKPFAEALAGLEPGDVSEPFQDEDFYHIVQLVDVGSKDGERTVRIRDLARRIVPSDSTYFAGNALMDSVRTLAQKTGLWTAATDAGLTVTESTELPVNGVVPALMAVPDITLWAHENPAGTISRVLATNDAWYIVEVGGTTPAGIQDVEEVRDQISEKLLRERRIQSTRAVIDRVAGRVKLGESLEAAAEAEGLEAKSTEPFTRRLGVVGLGRDPEVMAAAFMLPVGSVSPPVESGRGWAIVRVDERTDVDWTAFEDQRFALYGNLVDIKRSRLFEAFMTELRRNAKIEDFRT